MPQYYQSKADAEAAAIRYEDHFTVRTELEPYNGHVIVLSPKSAEVFSWPLLGLLTEVEIDLSGFARLRQRQSNYKAPPALDRPARPPAAPAKAPPPPPPPPAAARPAAPPAPPPAPPRSPV